MCSPKPNRWALVVIHLPHTSPYCKDKEVQAIHRATTPGAQRARQEAREEQVPQSRKPLMAPTAHPLVQIPSAAKAELVVRQLVVEDLEAKVGHQATSKSPSTGALQSTSVLDGTEVLPRQLFKRLQKQEMADPVLAVLSQVAEAAALVETPPVKLQV